MMISPNLPAELKAALDGKLQGFSRTDAARRSSQISTTYRAGGGSGTIKSDADALAYALARMPATYATVAASLNALTEIVPDLAPETLLDVRRRPGHRELGRRRGVLLAAGFHPARRQRRTEQAGARTGA
ncbi:ribosomal protein RSM22 (predicted rRNA methylase) [Bradyrhizobium sp. LM6.9]